MHFQLGKKRLITDQICTKIKLFHGANAGNQSEMLHFNWLQQINSPTASGRNLGQTHQPRLLFLNNTVAYLGEKHKLKPQRKDEVDLHDKITFRVLHLCTRRSRYEGGPSPCEEKEEPLRKTHNCLIHLGTAHVMNYFHPHLCS